MTAGWLILPINLLCCYNCASVSRGRVEGEKEWSAFFCSTISDQIVNLKTTGNPLWPTIFRCSCADTSREHTLLQQPSTLSQLWSIPSEPKTAAFRPEGATAVRCAYLPWTGMGLDLSPHPATSTGDKSLPPFQCRNQTKVIGKCHLAWLCLRPQFSRGRIFLAACEADCKAAVA